MSPPARRYIVVFLLFFTFGLLCCLVPMLRAIDYPLSLASSLPFSFVFGLLGWHQGRSQGTFPAACRECLAMSSLASAAVLVPVGIASLVTRVCEPAYGLLFFLAGPVASTVFSYSIGYSMAPRLARAWMAAAAMGALLLLSAVVAVAEFLFSPGIRFYGTFYGLYHGAVYDQAVFVETPYLWLRAWNLAGVALLLLLSRPSGRPYRLVLLWGTATLFAALSLFAGRLGFVSTGHRLEAELSGWLETEHFVVRYTPGGRGEAAAPNIADELEFRAHQLAARFDLAPETEPITAYVYESPQQKQRLMGAGRTSIAKPWLMQLHVHTHGVGGSLLAHELAHVMVGALADSWLRMPTSGLLLPRPGILEGAAVAAERGGALMTTHQWAKAMREVGRQPDLPALLEGLSFWRQSSSLAYTACGSFVRYLLDEHGTQALAKLYAGATFSEAYGLALPRLLEGWNAFLDTIPLDQDDLGVAEFVFSRPPVFEKACPYAGGRCFQRAIEAVKRRDSELVGPLAASAFRVTEGETGLTRSFVRLLFAVDAVEQGAVLLELLRQHHDGRAGAAIDAMDLATADSRWLVGQDNEAHGLYRSLASRPSAKWLKSGLVFRLGLSAHRVSQKVKRLTVSAHLRRDLPGLLESLLDQVNTLPPAARLRLAMGMEAIPALHDQALGPLLSGLENLDPSEAEMKRLGAFALVRLHYLTDNLAAARQVITTKLTGRLTPVQREELLDWKARIEWKEEQNGHGRTE